MKNSLVILVLSAGLSTGVPGAEAAGLRMTDAAGDANLPGKGMTVREDGILAELLSALSGTRVFARQRSDPSQVQGPAEITDPTTLDLGAPSSVRAGDLVSVVGTVNWGVDVYVAAEDPAGDEVGGLGPALGTDIRRALIVVDPERADLCLCVGGGEIMLSFRLELQSLPPEPLLYQPVIYEWDLTINGLPYHHQDGSTFGGVQWRRLNMCCDYSPLFPFTPHEPRTDTLYAWCVPDLIPGPVNCGGAGPVHGTYDTQTSTLTADFSTFILELGDGDLLGPGTPPGGGNIRSSIIPAATTQPGPGTWWVGGDDLNWQGSYRVPSPTVQFAMVPRGASPPDSFPYEKRIAALLDNGNRYVAFKVPTTGLAPGDYDLLARSCWGSNCALQRLPVALEP